MKFFLYLTISFNLVILSCTDYQVKNIQSSSSESGVFQENIRAQMEPVMNPKSKLKRVLYNNSGITTDLGVGLWAWPLPMDWDSDGDLDLVVSCPDVPFNGTYLFENPDGNVKMPVFLPPNRIGPGKKNVLVSYVDNQPRVLEENKEFTDFTDKKYMEPKQIYPTSKIHKTEGRVRFNLWRYVDFDGDGVMDLVVGPDDWGEYGWDNAYNEQGEWIQGPLHGYVYLIRNKGTTENPDYEKPKQLFASGELVDVYGAPFPNFADFDGDNDLDLICGEFLDEFTYFENTGIRREPRYAAPRRLEYKGKPLTMDLQMITPTSIDWDKDGDVDLIVGDEDGRVALVENTGEVEKGIPLFLPPEYFQQQAHYLKFGALVTPVSIDWDNDGDEDLICGNTAGYIGFIENLDGGNPPKWAPPKLLKANGETIRIQAGENGSIQGPAEAKWGYTTLSVADWDHDGLLDLIVNSIWGKVIWYRNIGKKHKPKLSKAQGIEVQWLDKPPKPSWNWWDPEGNELVTQWRTTPVVIDWNRDGLNDLVMLDHEGYLAFYEKKMHDGLPILLPPKRIFYMYENSVYNRRHEVIDKSEGLLRLNGDQAGRSGRRKLCFVDWNGDGNLDLLVNSENVRLLQNTGTGEGIEIFEDKGNLDVHKLAGHTTSPTTVDWDNDGVRDLLIGAEDGFFYYLSNPRSP